MACERGDVDCHTRVDCHLESDAQRHPWIQWLESVRASYAIARDCVFSDVGTPRAIDRRCETGRVRLPHMPGDPTRTLEYSRTWSGRTDELVRQPHPLPPRHGTKTHQLSAHLGDPGGSSPPRAFNSTPTGDTMHRYTVTMQLGNLTRFRAFHSITFARWHAAAARMQGWAATVRDSQTGKIKRG